MPAIPPPRGSPPSSFPAAPFRNPPSLLRHPRNPKIFSFSIFLLFFRETEICFSWETLALSLWHLFWGRSSTKTSRKMGNKLFFEGNGEKVGLHSFLLFRATIVGCFCSNLNNAKSTTCGKKLSVVAPPPLPFSRDRLSRNFEWQMSSEEGRRKFAFVVLLPSLFSCS